MLDSPAFSHHQTPPLARSVKLVTFFSLLDLSVPVLPRVDVATFDPHSSLQLSFPHLLVVAGGTHLNFLRLFFLHGVLRGRHQKCTWCSLHSRRLVKSPVGESQVGVVKECLVLSVLGDTFVVPQGSLRKGGFIID